jgi:hypothetical protein
MKRLVTLLALIPNLVWGQGYIPGSDADTSGVTLANIGSTPNANGASLVGQELTLQIADLTFGGLVSTADQSFNGIKLFDDGVAGPEAGLILQNTPTATGNVAIIRALINMTPNGKLLSLRDNTSSEVAYIDADGKGWFEDLRLTGIANYAIYEAATAQTAYRGDVANSAGRVPHRFGNNTALTTDGANIMGWYSNDNSTNVLLLEKSGVLDWPTGGADDCAGISNAMVLGVVTVTTTCVEAGDRIMLTHGGTGVVANFGQPYVSTITADTSFVITSNNIADTDTVNWIITR